MNGILRQYISYFVRPLLIWIIAFLSTAISVSAELTGRLSSELYIWEESDGVSHIRPYESLRLNLRPRESMTDRKLSFHSYIRWTTDLSDKSQSDPQTFVYDSYVRLSGLPAGSDIYLGRQFTYSGVGSALIDGLRLKYKITRRLELDIFGGSAVDGSDPERIRSLSDFGTAGGRVIFKLKNRSRFGLHYILRRSDGSVTYNRLGVDGRHDAHKWRLYGRIAYNAAGLRLSNILMRGIYNPGKWYFSLEYDWREPSVSANSLFSMVDFRRYRQTRFEVHHPIYHNLRIISRFNINLYSGENSWSGSLGLNGGSWSISWRHQSGYGGDNDGITGFVNYRFTRSWEAYASAVFSSYRIQDMQEERSDAYVTTAGVQKQIGENLFIRTEGEYLRNAVKSDDMRYYLRVTKGF